MRNLLLSVILLHIFIISYSQNRSYTIRGSINGIKEGVIKVLPSEDNDFSDSAKIVNGNFVLTGNFSHAEQRVFNVLTPNYIWAFQAFIEDEGEIDLQIDTLNAQYYPEHALIFNVIQTGSPIQSVYDKFEKESGMVEYTYFLQEKYKESLLRENDSLYQKKVYAQIDSASGILNHKMRNWTERYITENPYSPAGPYILNTYVENLEQSSPYRNFYYLDSLLNLFEKEALLSVYYKHLKELSLRLKKIAPGNLAPDFTLQQIDKIPFSLTQLRGKVVLLDFWASWCAPCRAAIPKWKNVYKKYNQQGLEIVGIATDNWKDWTRALNQENMPWMQVIANSENNEAKEIGKLYEHSAIPFYVLIDKEGKIILASGDSNIVYESIEKIFMQ